MKKLFGTIDIGTHSAILSLVSLENNKLNCHLEKFSAPNLGEGLAESGRISESAIKRLHISIREFLMVSARMGAKILKIGGTHPFRMAENGPQVLEETAKYLHAPFEILTTERESALVRTALLHQMDDANICILDIGGGSSEISTPKKSASIPIGAVNLFEKNGAHPDQGNRQQSFKMTKKFPLKFAPDKLAVIGGTATTLAMLMNADAEFLPAKIDGKKVELETVSQWIEKLADLKPEYRRQVPGLPDDRVDYIIPGLCILEASLKRYNLTEFTISTWGLRQGLALEELKIAAAI